MWTRARKQIHRFGISMALLCPLSFALADGGQESHRGVSTFDECVAESGKILKMYPPKCVTKDGKVFIETPKTPKTACKNLCGDGECQEIVCMAVGCPCAENKATCPKDCVE